MRGLEDWPLRLLAPPLILTFSPQAGRRDAPRPRQATIAREFRRKPLKRLNPRPEDSLAPLQRGEGWGEGLGGLAAAASRPAPHPNLLPAGGEKGRPAAPAGDDRPGIPPQTPEKIESAPGDSLAPLQRGEGWGEGLAGLAAAACSPGPSS